MSLARDYLKAIKTHLLRFAVWQPGETIEPGDVGEMDGRQFKKVGNVRDFISTIDFEIESHSVDEIRFQTSNVVCAEANSESLIPDAGITQSQVSIHVQFESKGGVVFHGINCEANTVKEMHFVKFGIDRDSWPEGYVLVSEVTKANAFALIISKGRNAGIQLKGESSVLNALRIAEAGVEVIGANHQCYYQRGSGPVLLGLYGFKFFGSTIKPLAPGDPGEFLRTPPDSSDDFVELFPNDDAFLDDDWEPDGAEEQFDE